MNLVIKSQRAGAENAEEYRISEKSAAIQAAVSAEKGAEHAEASGGNAASQTAPMAGYDPDLTEVADRWATLPDAVRLAVMSLVRPANQLTLARACESDVFRGVVGGPFLPG